MSAATVICAREQKSSPSVPLRRGPARSAFLRELDMGSELHEIGHVIDVLPGTQSPDS